jgi:hypothetical protein
MTGVVFATPRDTAKYTNILQNRRVALLIDTRSNTDTAYMRSEAVTIVATLRVYTLHPTSSKPFKWPDYLL